MLAAAGGLLTDAAFPGLGWFPLAFVGMALLFTALGRDASAWNALVGLVWGIAFFFPHLMWIEGAVGLVPWIALTVLEAGYVALFGFAWTWARRGRVIRGAARWQVPAAAVLWTAVEELRSITPYGGFPWGRLAFSQVDALDGRLAWIGGVPLVSAVVAAVGLLLAVVVHRIREAEVAGALGAGLAALALVGAGVFVPLDTTAQSGTVTVAAIQGNVPDRGLDSLNQAREVVRNHRDESLALLSRMSDDLDLMIWPENAADFDPRTDVETRNAVEQVVRTSGTPLLLGTSEFPDSGGRYNIGMLWLAGTGPAQIYIKQHPVPFAEYIPMRDVARRFSSAVDRVSTDMRAGDSPGVFEVPVARLDRDITVGDVICFEVAYDALVRTTVATGAEILVVQTNNATFGPYDESTQQLAMSRLRAIELGRATIQVSTVGVSAVIAPNGTVVEQTKLFTADSLVAAVPLRTTSTPAARFGALISWTIRFLGVAIVLAGVAGAVRPATEERPHPTATRRT